MIEAVAHLQSHKRLVALGLSETDYFLTLSCCGVCIGLRSNAPALLAALTRLIPGSESENVPEVVFSIHDSGEQNTARRYAVGLNGKVAPLCLQLRDALDLLQCYMQEILAMRARNLVLVHAAVVGWGGSAVLLPGASGSGKTTLAMALVKQGAAYYSDDLALLDETGRVHPYLRVPRLRTSLGQKTATHLTELIFAGEIRPEPVPVALVVLSQYSETASVRREDLLGRDTFWGLLRNTVAVRSRPELTLKVLKEVSLGARGVQLERGGARAAASAVLGMMKQMVGIQSGETK